MTKGPDPAEFEHLKEPQISEMATEKVIVIKLDGEPNDISGQAIGDLYKVYYQLDVDKAKPVAPKARWINFDEDKSNLTGEFALTVPDSINSLPAGTTVELTKWEYGEVAEILHEGSYAGEEATIEKLKKYIADQGYEISGDHEEEYLKGPGMFGKGDESKYLTIIRYPVKKKANLDTEQSVKVGE
ncbi:GyrI-like domain-containing protein [Patescibacteria group bacterium]|nr:GyrI-like domain-containing protein [Patescibacteria group bacterium]